MFRTLFINKNFFLLWAGKFVSQIGDKFYGIALAWWILQRTNSPAIMGFFMAASVLPGLVFGPFAGALIDRLNRKMVIILADVLRGIFVVAIAWLSNLEILELWHVVSAAVVISFSSAFFDPAIQAVIPQIVKEDQLPKANALSQIIGSISIILGPVLGAIFVSFFGFTWVFFINGISYLLSGLSENFIILPPHHRKHYSQGNLWEEIREGLLFLLDRKKIMIVIMLIGVVHLFIGDLMVTLPFLAKELRGNGIQNLGNMEMSMGLGMLLASIYIHRKGQRTDVNYLFTFIKALGVCFLCIGILKYLLVSSVIPYMFLVSFVGILIANGSVYWQSLLQRNIPNDMAGRVFSVSSMIGNISLPLAYGIFGVLLHYISISHLMLFSGVSLTLLTVLLHFSYTKNL